MGKKSKSWMGYDFVLTTAFHRQLTYMQVRGWGEEWAEEKKKGKGSE